MEQVVWRFASLTTSRFENSGS